MVDFLFLRNSYMFGDFGGGDLCGITTEGGLIEEEEEVKSKRKNGKWKRKKKNGKLKMKRRGRGHWVADSGSGSVLLVGKG